MRCIRRGTSDMALLWGLLAIGLHLIAHTTSLPLDAKQEELSSEKVDLIADLLTPLLQERNAAMGPLEMINPEDLLHSPIIGNRKKRRTNYDRYTKHLVEIAPLRHKKNKDGKTPLAIILAASDRIKKNNKRKKIKANKANVNVNKQKVATNERDDINLNIRKNKQDKELKFILDIESVDENKNISNSDSEDVSVPSFETDHSEIAEFDWKKVIANVNSKEISDESSEIKDGDSKEKLIKGIQSWINENSIPINKKTTFIESDSNESKKIKNNKNKSTSIDEKERKYNNILENTVSLERKEANSLEDNSKLDKVIKKQEESKEVIYKVKVDKVDKESKQGKNIENKETKEAKSDEVNSKQIEINENQVSSEKTLNNSKTKIKDSIENTQNKERNKKESSRSVEHEINEIIKNTKVKTYYESEEKHQSIDNKERNAREQDKNQENKETNQSRDTQKKDASKEHKIKNDSALKSQSDLDGLYISNESNRDNIIYSTMKTILNEIPLLESNKSDSEESVSSEVTVYPITRAPGNLSAEQRIIPSKIYEESKKNDWLEQLEDNELLVSKIDNKLNDEYHTIEKETISMKNADENLSNESQLDKYSYYAKDNILIFKPESTEKRASENFFKDVQYVYANGEYGHDNNNKNEISDERTQEIHFRSSQMMRNSMKPQVIADKTTLTSNIQEKPKKIELNDNDKESKEDQIIDIHKHDPEENKNRKSSEYSSESNSDSLKDLEELIGKDNLILLNELRKHTKLPSKGETQIDGTEILIEDITNQKVTPKSNEIELIATNELKNNNDVLKPDIIGVIDSLHDHLDLDNKERKKNEDKINSRKREKSPKLKTYNLSFLFTK